MRSDFEIKKMIVADFLQMHEHELVICGAYLEGMQLEMRILNNKNKVLFLLFRG